MKRKERVSRTFGYEPLADSMQRRMVDNEDWDWATSLEDVLREIYTMGCCWALATAIHYRYGWPIEYVVSDEDPRHSLHPQPCLLHAWVRHPDDERRLDIHGFLPLDEIMGFEAGMPVHEGLEGLIEISRDHADFERNHPSILQATLDAELYLVEQLPPKGTTHDVPLQGLGRA